MRESSLIKWYNNFKEKQPIGAKDYDVEACSLINLWFMPDEIKVKLTTTKSKDWEEHVFTDGDIVSVIEKDDKCYVVQEDVRIVNPTWVIVDTIGNNEVVACRTLVYGKYNKW